jgi:hypothetical protein
LKVTLDAPVVVPAMADAASSNPAIRKRSIESPGPRLLTATFLGRGTIVCRVACKRENTMRSGRRQ